jgi:outer membrane receptor protein involved in Fe transport
MANLEGDKLVRQRRPALRADPRQRRHPDPDPGRRLRARGAEPAGDPVRGLSGRDQHGRRPAALLRRPDQPGDRIQSAAGNMYYFTKSDRRFNNWLPSLNVRYELIKDMIARFGASRTIGRQNYNIVGAGFGTPVCDAQGCRVTGPNPDLKPLTADNLDLSWAWYFASRSLVSVNLFYSKIDGYEDRHQPAAPRSTCGMRLRSRSRPMR